MADYIERDAVHKYLEKTFKPIDPRYPTNYEIWQVKEAEENSLTAEIITAHDDGTVTRISELTYQPNGITVTISYPDGEHMYFLNRACVELGQRVKEGEPIGEYENV